MSGEFGSYSSGYFHDQMSFAADDLESGRDALTREWGKFFAEFVPIARAISWSEACDSGLYYPISETIARIQRLKSILGDIESHCSVYKEVADNAVREYVRANAKAEAAE